jgi:hypothetical protein
MLPERCFIIGSGNSISSGLSHGLWDKLSKEVTFGINDSIKFFNSTSLVFGDWEYYAQRKSYLINHPLVIGRFCCQIGHPEFECPKYNDLILLQGSNKYHGKESFQKGIYSGILTGGFTLTLAIQLGFTEIFILGFDCTEINGKTHWYQDIPKAGEYKGWDSKPRTGVGKDEQGRFKTGVYNNSLESIHQLWEPFKQELNNIKIWNVSPGSLINTFSKMDYQGMFAYLKNHKTNINQIEVQKEIRKILQPYNKAPLTESK